MQKNPAIHKISATTYNYKIACIIIFVGAISSMGTMWDLADVTMGFMAIINLPVICILGSKALKALEDYKSQMDKGTPITFVAKNIGIKEKLDYWN